MKGDKLVYNFTSFKISIITLLKEHCNIGEKGGRLDRSYRREKMGR